MSTNGHLGSPARERLGSGLFAAGVSANGHPSSPARERLGSRLLAAAIAWLVVMSMSAAFAREAAGSSHSPTVSSTAVAAPLPDPLVEALRRHDPIALADTTLPRLGDLDHEQRAALAKRLAGWRIGPRVAAWAFLQVGAPYQLGPLGEEAPPDTDPVIEFETTDCAVLNLVSAAMAHATDAGGEREAMAVANYRGAVVAYARRFHFTTDRLDACPYYRDITAQVAGGACRRRVVELNRRADGSRWIPIDWSRRREIVYVPRTLGSRFARWHDQGRLPDAMGVAFVKASMLGDGLDVVHESMLWKGRTLLHASSLTGRVVTISWPEFLAGPGRGYDGFVLFEYR